MSKHTEGPWHIGDKIHGDYYVWGPDPKAYGYIAQVNACGSKTNPQAERDANARLIAASPALLAACKAALAFSYSPGVLPVTPEPHPLQAELRAAISLAEPTEGVTDG